METAFISSDKSSIYWDYIKLDPLLSLQETKTQISDEKIFLTYHQIVELYYSLVLHELNRLTYSEIVVSEDFFAERIRRMNRYMCHVVDAFDVLTHGMDTDEFLAFRKLLGNASGFQSMQHRKIEIGATNLAYLAGINAAAVIDASDDALLSEYESVYWRCIPEFACDDSAKQMLSEFEIRYKSELVECARAAQSQNLWQIFKRDFYDNDGIRQLLKRFDQLFNMEWKEAHLSTAIHHMSGMRRVQHATGGSDWRRYLLKGQRAHSVFYPELWEASELNAFEQRCVDLVAG